MKNILLDTALLAVPNFAVSEEAAEELINRVTHFASIVISQVPINFLISTYAEEHLWNNNMGPSREQIEDFINLMEIGDRFSAMDLLRQYQILIERSKNPIDIFGFEVAEYSSLFINPPLPPILTPSPLQPETERSISTSALLVSEGESFSIASGIDYFRDCKLSVDVQIDKLRVDQDIIPISLPKHISADIKAISHLREIVKSDNSFDFWREASNEYDLHFAISLEAIKLLATSGVPHKNLKKFTIGPDFIESLVRHQCSAGGRFSSSTHNLCAQIVANLCSRAVGPFGRPKQTIRSFDQARAFRVHLTKGNQGLRLMFWETVTGYEFANVGTKFELSISTGRMGGAVDVDLSEIIDECVL